MMSFKKIGFAFIAAALLFSCGCADKNGKVNCGSIEEFVCGQAADVMLMAASGDVLYTLEYQDGAAFFAYGIDGNKTKSTVIPELNAYDVKCICADDDLIYAVIDEGNGFSICSVDIDLGMVEQICELNETDNIEKIGVYDNRLYWLGERYGEAKAAEPFITEEGAAVYFEDTGKKMGYVDLESGKNVFSDIEFPVSFSVSGDGVTVYAFDSEGGYYFVDCGKSNSWKYTNKLGFITNFEFYGSGGEFAFIGANDFHGVLPVSRADSESGVIRAINGVYPFFAADICASGSGYVWLKTADNAMSAEKRIKRYDLSGVTISGDPIRVISSRYFTEQPFAAGSEIQTEQVSNEGFALKVLSLDKGYDAAMISSDQSAAHDVKEKGSFYPLNDVSGVSEYLDRCFPYIKDAVTDEDGNIRMLPINVEIPLIVYNEKTALKTASSFHRN